MSQYPHQAAVPVQQNTLGIVGFVISLVGLFVTGGMLCPIGLIISLVGLGRQPRGFAIAGVIVGAIGSCGIFLIIFVFGAALLAALGLAIAAIALAEPEKIELTNDMVRTAAAAVIYREENGALPADLSLLELRVSTAIDPWGNRYEYHFTEDDPGFDLISAGADGAFGTEDDVKLSTLGETWEAAEAFDVDVHADGEDGGRVLLNFGRYTVEAIGDDESGTVILKDGNRVVRIVGDEDGGHITVDEAGAASEEEVDAEEVGEVEGVEEDAPDGDAP